MKNIHKTLLLTFLIHGLHCMKATNLAHVQSQIAIDKKLLNTYNKQLDKSILLDKMLKKEKNKGSLFYEESCEKVDKTILSFALGENNLEDLSPLEPWSCTSRKFYRIISSNSKIFNLIHDYYKKKLDEDIKKTKDRIYYHEEYLAYHHRVGAILDRLAEVKESDVLILFDGNFTDHIRQKILSFIPTKDLMTCSHTSRVFYKLVNQFDFRHKLLTAVQIHSIDFTTLRKVGLDEYPYDPFTSVCDQLKKHGNIFNLLFCKRFTKEQIKQVTNERTIDFIIAHRPLDVLLSMNLDFYDALLDLYRARVLSLYETPIMEPIINAYMKQKLGLKLDVIYTIKKNHLISSFVEREKKLGIIFDKILAHNFDLLLYCVHISPLDVLPYFTQRVSEDFRYDQDSFRGALQNPDKVATLFGLLAQKYPAVKTYAHSDKINKQEVYDFYKPIDPLYIWHIETEKYEVTEEFPLTRICKSLSNKATDKPYDIPSLVGEIAYFMHSRDHYSYRLSRSPFSEIAANLVHQIVCKESSPYDSIICFGPSSRPVEAKNEELLQSYASLPIITTAATTFLAFYKKQLMEWSNK